MSAGERLILDHNVVLRNLNKHLGLVHPEYISFLWIKLSSLIYFCDSILCINRKTEQSFTLLHSFNHFYLLTWDMHQIFLHLPDLSVFFPLFRPQSLRSLRASHRALSCLSSPLLIFHFSSAESAQAPLSHVNLWVVRVSDPPSHQTWTSLVALQSIRPDYWSLPCCRGSNSSRLICIHPSVLQFSRLQERPGACLRLLVSAVRWSVLAIPLLRCLKAVSWTTRNCSWTPTITSTQQHTHIRTHAQGRLHLVLSASWRVAREGVLIRVSSDTVVTKPQQRHAFNVFFISAKLFEQRCLTTLNAGSKLLSEEPNEKWKHQQRLQQCSLGLWVPFLCLYQRKHAAILKSATNTTKFVPGAFYSRCCHSCSDIFAQHRSDNIQNGIYELRRERLNEVDQF